MLNDHIDVESELLKYYSSRTETKVYILTTFLQLVVTGGRPTKSHAPQNMHPSFIFIFSSAETFYTLKS